MDRHDLKMMTHLAASERYAAWREMTNERRRVPESPRRRRSARWTMLAAILYGTLAVAGIAKMAQDTERAPATHNACGTIEDARNGGKHCPPSP